MDLPWERLRSLVRATVPGMVDRSCSQEVVSRALEQLQLDRAPYEDSRPETSDEAAESGEPASSAVIWRVFLGFFFYWRRFLLLLMPCRSCLIWLKFGLTIS